MTSSDAASPTPITPRIAVVGDVGGHSVVLGRLLADLGVELAGDLTSHGWNWDQVQFNWPDDLHVVSVGDLVHRGPDSLGVVLLVDRLIEAGHWTQVIGNHEAHEVHRPVFRSSEVVDPVVLERLRAWWADGRMHPAAVIETEADGDWLVTHAGLTSGFWKHLGSPTDAAALLAALRASVADESFFRTTGVILNDVIDPTAGPLWAEAGHESYGSWLDEPEPSPFHQTHGHSSAYLWNHGRWRCYPRVEQQSTKDESVRRATFIEKGMRFVGVDPDHGPEPVPIHVAMVLGPGRVRVS